MIRPKAFFFDMDGVLFDSMPAHARAWTAAMHQYGFPFEPLDAYLVEGRTGHSVIDSYFRQRDGRPATEAEKQQIYGYKTHLFEQEGQPKAMPGVHDVLRAIKAAGMQIFVVTGSGQVSLLSRLEHSFPGIFSAQKMVTAFDVKHGKPNPEPYLMALQKSGVQASEAIVIENAPLGVQAGHAAGLFTVGVNTGILQADDLAQAGADLVLPNMAALLEWLQPLLQMP